MGGRGQRVNEITWTPSRQLEKATSLPPDFKETDYVFYRFKYKMS